QKHNIEPAEQGTKESYSVIAVDHLAATALIKFVAMVQEGPVNVCFTAQSYGVDVAFDPQTQEQLLSFRFGVTVSLPQLLQQLIEIQKRDAATGAVPGASQTGGASLQGVKFPTQPRTTSDPNQGLVAPYISSSVQVSATPTPSLGACGNSLEETAPQASASETPIPRAKLAALDV
ncbi:Kidins220, partial [Symbiodinium sp. CCMP2456]